MFFFSLAAISNFDNNKQNGLCQVVYARFDGFEIRQSELNRIKRNWIELKRHWLWIAVYKFRIDLTELIEYLQREVEESFSEGEAEVADGNAGHGEMNQLRQRKEELTQKHFDQERRKQVNQFNHFWTNETLSHLTKLKCLMFDFG